MRFLRKYEHELVHFPRRVFGCFKIIGRRTRFLTAICKTRLCHEKSLPSLCHLRISDIFFHPAKEIRDQKNEIRGQ